MQCLPGERKKYLWRHITIINYIMQSVDTEKFKVFADMPGHTANGGVTVPADIFVTVHKLDLVIIDEDYGSLHFVELTNLDTRHRE